MDGWIECQQEFVWGGTRVLCFGTHICVLEVVLGCSNSFPDGLVSIWLGGCCVRLFVGSLRSFKRVKSPVVWAISHQTVISCCCYLRNPASINELSSRNPMFFSHMTKTHLGKNQFTKAKVQELVRSIADHPKRTEISEKSYVSSMGSHVSFMFWGL